MHVQVPTWREDSIGSQELLMKHFLKWSHICPQVSCSDYCTHQFHLLSPSLFMRKKKKKSSGASHLRAASRVYEDYPYISKTFFHEPFHYSVSEVQEDS